MVRTKYLNMIMTLLGDPAFLGGVGSVVIKDQSTGVSEMRGMKVYCLTEGHSLHKVFFFSFSD